MTPNDPGCAIGTTWGKADRSMRTVHTVTTDDLSGQEGATTITFGLRGRTYEIDLAPANEAKLDKALAPFVEKARKLPANGRRASTASTAPARTDQAQVRAWAQQHGYDLGDRGRIPAVVLAAYDEATG